MNQFSIKDIENLSGIKAHTWRIWEQRYGLGIPQRKDSNHRFYDNENLKQILRISYLYHGGLKISKIASLNTDQIRTLARERLSTEQDYEYYIKELTEAAIDLDEDRFEDIFEDALSRAGLEDVIVNIIYPFQHRVGVLWLTDHVIPAQEHFTSNIIRRKFLVAIDQLPRVKETQKKEIVLFTPEHEHHEMPLQFIYYLLRRNQNKVTYFGSNVSLETLVGFSQRKSFNCVLFHLVTNLTDQDPNEYLRKVSSLFPDKQIIMSGVIARQITRIPDNARLLLSMEEVLAFTGE